MTEDEMVQWHYPFNRHGFEQALGNGEDREAWCATVHGGHKELDKAEQLNNNNNICRLFSSLGQRKY